MIRVRFTIFDHVFLVSYLLQLTIGNTLFTGVFMCSLSSEYAIAASTFSLTKAQVYEASLRSIDTIFADDKVKDELKRVWREWWQGHNKNAAVNHET